MLNRIHAVWLAVLLVCPTFFAEQAFAQTEFNFEAGTFIPVLPDYRAGSIVGPGFVPVQTNIFEDNQSDIGPQLGLNGFYQLGRNRRLAFDLDLAWINSMGSTETFADPGPTQSVWFPTLNGTFFLSTPDGGNATFSLDSDVLHYAEYIGIQQRMQTRFGGLDLGLGFSHFAFEQDHTLDASFSTGTSGQYIEGLDSDFFGGELRGTLHRRFRSHPMLIDFGIGLFGMDADYSGNSLIRNAAGTIVAQESATSQVDDFAVTLDIGLRTEKVVRGICVRPNVHLRYISSMPEIHHPQTIVSGPPVFLDTTDALVVTTGLEIRL